MKTIVVVSYNPDWQREFEQFKAVYEPLLAGHIVSVEHVGSTSVVGLAAKPILDIDIVIENRDKLAVIAKLLGSIGYEHRGDYGVPGREAFKPIIPHVPFMGAMEHHLYVCIDGCLSLRNHLALRNYLRSNPEAVEAYGTLKMQLAKRFPHDLDSYLDGKTDLIVDILKKCRFNKNELDIIAGINKLS